MGSRGCWEGRDLNGFTGGGHGSEGFNSGESDAGCNSLVEIVKARFKRALFHLGTPPDSALTMLVLLESRLRGFPTERVGPSDHTLTRDVGFAK